jgi:subtilase family serine protease
VNKVTLPDGTEGDLGAVSNLNAGESIILNIAITFSATGPYTLQARVDSANQVAEVSEVNNSGSLPISVS